MKKLLVAAALIGLAGFIVFVVVIELDVKHSHDPKFIKQVLEKTVVIDELPANFHCEMAFDGSVYTDLLFSNDDYTSSFRIASMKDLRGSEFKRLDEEALLKRLFPDKINSITKRGVMKVGQDELHYIIGPFHYDKRATKPAESLIGYILPKANPDRVISIYGLGNAQHSIYNFDNAKKFFQCIKDFPA